MEDVGYADMLKEIVGYTRGRSRTRGCEALRRGARAGPTPSAARGTGWAVEGG